MSRKGLVTISETCLTKACSLTCLCKVEMRLVVSSHAVVGDLQLLRGLHIEPRDVVHPLVDVVHLLRLLAPQPRRLRDAVRGRLQLARLVILHRRTLELQVKK